MAKFKEYQNVRTQYKYAHLKNALASNSDGHKRIPKFGWKHTKRS